MKKKTLYLVGGAVRDHLTGKTPKDFDLVTDATPPQIRRVFKARRVRRDQEPKGKRHPKGKDKDLPDGAGPGQGEQGVLDRHLGRHRHGRELPRPDQRRGVRTGDAAGNHKGENGDVHDKVAFGGIDQDADRRDFTINAMYIPLEDGDGPNAKLIDLHGGIHHLKSGNVNPIGNFRDRLDEDPLRALRYIRFIARFGKGDKIPDEHRRPSKRSRTSTTSRRSGSRPSSSTAWNTPTWTRGSTSSCTRSLGILIERCSRTWSSN
jgi:poly(A) polymerase